MDIFFCSSSLWAKSVAQVKDALYRHSTTMVTRTRTQQELGGLGTHTHVRNHTVSSQLQPVTVRLDQVDRTMTDVVVPHFNEKLAAGAVINNPCSKTKTRVYYVGNGSYFGRYNADPSKTNIVSGTGSHTGFWLARGWSCPNMDFTLGGTQGDRLQAAQSKALAAIDKAPFAIAEDVATLNLTLKFLRKPFAGLSELSQRYKRAKKGLSTVYKNGKRRQSYESLVSSLWLEYRFGFMPLTRSVVNVINSLNVPNRKYDKLQTAHGEVLFEDTRSAKYVGSGYTYDRTCKKVVRTRATVQYRLAPPLSQWRAKYGLRFKDLPELMWDLFPYSFMVDRIFDVGDAVRGATNFLDPSVTIVGGVNSEEVYTLQGRSVISQQHSQWTVTITPDWRYDESHTYSRSLWTPSIFDTVPPVLPGNLVKDLTSIADLSALILQRVR